MRLKFYLGTIILGITLLQLACVKQKGKNPLIEKPKGDTAKVSECDTITYTKHIKFITDKYCGTNPQCHTSGSSSGGLDLDTYDQVKICASSNKLKQAIFNAIPQQMPPDGNDQLSDAQKKLINCWLNNGLKN